MKKNKSRIFLAAAAAGAAGSILSRRLQRQRQAILAWERRQQPDLDRLACPACRSRLELGLVAAAAVLRCTGCGRVYLIAGGIPNFLDPQDLTGSNLRFARMYDWFSWIYRLFSLAAFTVIGMPEEQARREITDRLNPQGGPVLEVSIGPGVNLPYLVYRADVGAIHGLDISQGQLARCRSYLAGRDWPVHLELGSAEQLPYADNAFAGVFHLGGINFFNDPQKAIAEMVRVARPGARILICDENEKGARAYERFLPGFTRISGTDRPPVVPPLHLVPPEMQEVRLFEAWNGWMYCLEFRKP